MRQRGLVAFVDGLTNLFAPGSTPQTTSSAGSSRTTDPPATQNSLLSTLTSANLAHIQRTIQAAINQLLALDPSRKILLILDTPTILLETTTPPITATDLTNFLLRLRSQVHATVLALPADTPFVQPAIPDRTGTPLEVENAAFIVGMVHEARLILSCRRLDTGWASDVSGVISATRGGAVDDQAEEVEGDSRDGSSRRLDEGEWLYHVAGDLSVKVWVRGASVV